jgi:hypothetical protein
VNAERKQCVGKGPADQEFHRQVIDALYILLVLLARGFHPARDEPVAHREFRGMEPVARLRGHGILADSVHETVGNGAPERIDGAVELFELQVDGCHRTLQKCIAAQRASCKPRSVKRDGAGGIGRLRYFYFFGNDPRQPWNRRDIRRRPALLSHFRHRKKSGRALGRAFY